MELIDSHAHIDDPAFDADRDDVIARAAAAGVSEIVVVGAGDSLAIAERAVALVESRPGLHATVGIHPHHVAAIEESWWERLRELARRPSVVAVGETGLDYFYDSSPRDLQREMFARFIELAADVGKPVVCHIRDAHDDAVAILDAAAGRGVAAIIHCFTGGPDDARRYIERGFALSFSGIATFRNAEPIRAAAVLVPDDQILLETDCPYLAPVPNRGKRNEPSFLVQTAEVIARERGVEVTALAASTTANARRVLVLTSNRATGIQPPRSGNGA